MIIVRCPFCTRGTPKTETQTWKAPLFRRARPQRYSCCTRPNLKMANQGAEQHMCGAGSVSLRRRPAQYCRVRACMVQFAQTGPGFTAFRTTLESAQNSFHLAIGGDMTVGRSNLLQFSMIPSCLASVACLSDSRLPLYACVSYFSITTVVLSKLYNVLRPPRYVRTSLPTKFLFHQSSRTFRMVGRTAS
jgi:hypothetical protein